jgi:anti-anti-sigma factor
MSARASTGFHVQLVGPSGTLLLRGELDLSTVQDLQDQIDAIMVPGQPVVLDLAQCSFLDSSAIHCFIRTASASGHPVVLLNTTPTVRRILDLGIPEPVAWVFDGEDRSLTIA